MISGKKINNDLESKEVKKIEKGENIKRKWIFVVSISIAFGTVLMTVPVIRNLIFNNPITIVGTDNCMTWVKNHFEKTQCTTTFDTKIVPLDQVRLKTFKKVKVTMATQFFSEETEKPRIWYHKTKKGELEYFSAPGLHPINGATLLKITPYIIETYVPLHSNNKKSFVQ